MEVVSESQIRKLPLTWQLFYLKNYDTLSVIGSQCQFIVIIVRLTQITPWSIKDQIIEIHKTLENSNNYPVIGYQY